MSEAARIFRAVDIPPEREELPNSNHQRSHRHDDREHANEFFALPNDLEAAPQIKADSTSIARINVNFSALGRLATSH